ncbi:MAG TPA: transketolase [Hyphomicrobiaceae bacterium]|nr:transketolase [Hyphomicrobiaceae bacterium]
MSALPLDRMADAIRILAMDAVERARSGHPGMPMGMADVATVLFTQVLKFDPSAPDWADRDRLVLSAGHGSMLLYALLYLAGTAGVGLDDIKRFRQLGAKTAGHPEYGHCPGVETTTGPLGQGLATAVGMALAERMLNARYGDGLVDHHTYVIAGDGCLMEGISHEAIDLAGHLRLSRLILLFDDNGITIDGSTALSTSMDQLKRFAAAGWNVTGVDGHAPLDIAAALALAQRSERPSLIACRTLIGHGAPGKQGTKEMHGAPLGATEIAAARAAMDWPAQPFEVPAGVLSAWRQVGARGRIARERWQERVDAMPAEDRRDFLERLSGKPPAAAIGIAIDAAKHAFVAERPRIATRIASQRVLTHVIPVLPGLVGGSADLTGSNGTRTKDQTSLAPGAYAGGYINFGVREHAMAAAMNGLALHGGFIPYGGTFLVFSDYARPAIRLAALMRQRVIYVMTHDSIGLGEDGPTHQPVEHLASLRAIPNLLVLRPADAVETAEAWGVALAETSRPSVLCLTRQELPALRTEATDGNLVARGAYVLIEPPGGRDVTLLATGSEVALAVEAATQLAAKGIAAAVVSMPSWELFGEQSESYRQKVLGSAPHIAIEAGAQLGWERWIGRQIGHVGRFIGMRSFGASAPADQLYRHFGITPEVIVVAAEVAAAASRPTRK